MANNNNSHRMEGEEQEALFQAYSCNLNLYYVQSPSTTSHANSTDCGRHPDSAILSPLYIPTTTTTTTSSSTNHHHHHKSHHKKTTIREATSTLSRYSSSRASSDSFLHLKKVDYDFGPGGLEVGKERCEGGGDGGGVGEGEERGGWWRFFSLDYSSSCFCVAFQIWWRLLVSVGIALLVFFLATKPPLPKMDTQIVGVRQFDLSEGIDYSGISTKILTFNCSLEMKIDNLSKLYGLHVQSPKVTVAFGHHIFAASKGEDVYVERNTLSTVPIHLSMRDQAMYAAGRDMEDKLESEQGLPLLVHVSSSSSYHIVWGLVRPKFNHHVECFLVLDGAYDIRNHTQVFHSTCTASTYHS
ncbi:hypothetical protein QJS10_CPB19g01068 [Acorus calamus]|uniref:Late embryogenesis abundant protein LEA-2 subgroup domain-containing protein n=1 Tax=Acorus calamus TaxID=4465 RepID=A0AAV9CGB6_ACOCL|nr:hypothetical protein QJS10_CPB19g01068 [Acorus calamus]